jgi:hypothetical protein
LASGSKPAAMKRIKKAVPGAENTGDGFWLCGHYASPAKNMTNSSEKEI